MKSFRLINPFSKKDEDNPIGDVVGDIVVYTPAGWIVLIPLAAVATILIQNIWGVLISLALIAIVFILKIKSEVKKGTSTWLIVIATILSIIIYTFLAVIIYKFYLFTQESNF